ncbi:MAG TPA: pyridoxamine 5'-phosphate oxidase family protein [Kribbella sp.]|nr:pyridoxamine 5'-phosphate oxidase family protein [Kribbella sp.]
MTILSEEECWQRLETADVGRLAVVLVGEPEIFPVNFVADDRTLVFKTAEGTKLFAITASPRVALESDGYDAGSGEAWSVVVKGTAERLDHFPDIYAAEELPLFPWQAGVKQWFVRIAGTTATGVRFTIVRGPRDE